MVDFLFPASAINPSKVDEHFTWQADIVSENSSVALVDLDELKNNGFRVFKRLQFIQSLIYRGWMLTSSQYRQLHDALSVKNINLMTTADQYTKAHHFDGWYDIFADFTPASVTLDPDATPEEILDAAASLKSKSFIVKDYVKSRKSEWNTACFARNLETLPSIVQEFVRLQKEDDVLTGKVVVRAFENFDKSVGEARVWWVNGKAVLITAHPDTPHLSPNPDLEGVAQAVQTLGCPFVTTDLVLREDNVWRVVEVGDGQVSDFPKTADFAKLTQYLSLMK